MGQVLKHGERLVDDVMARPSVQVGDHAHAACVMLEARVVEAAGTKHPLLSRLHRTPLGLRPEAVLRAHVNSAPAGTTLARVQRCQL